MVGPLIPIIVRVSTVAIGRGTATAIGRWAGGSVAKKYIATAVSRQAIKAVKKLETAEGREWVSLFRTDPGVALRGAADGFVRSELQDVIDDLSPVVSRQLSAAYNEALVRESGKALKRELLSNTASEDLVVKFDTDRLIEKTTENIINQGLAWQEGDRAIALNTRQQLNSKVANRDYIDNSSQISTADILESAENVAFYDNLDESKLTYTVIGPDDALRGKVRSPLEAIMSKVFDVDA